MVGFIRKFVGVRMLGRVGMEFGLLAAVTKVQGEVGCSI
jgi:hypothetical protein